MKSNRVATERFYVINSSLHYDGHPNITPGFSAYAASMQGYDRAGYRLLLAEAGFYGIRFLTNWGGSDEGSKEFLLIVAQKRP